MKFVALAAILTGYLMAVEYTLSLAEIEEAERNCQLGMDLAACDWLEER